MPGIGKKTAEKIIFALKGKIGGLDAIPGGISATPISAMDNEVISALTSLGYSVAEAQGALAGLPKDEKLDLEEKLRRSLASLGLSLAYPHSWWNDSAWSTVCGEPLRSQASMPNSICIYCGSSFGGDPNYAAVARAMGVAIARRGKTLVYGGSTVGLMGAVADAALEAGGFVIGVMPQALVDKEIQHRGLTKLHVVASMHERKALMIDLSDAMIALPGGFGTFEELTEAVTWAQLGFHGKPCGLLNVNGFYNGLIMLMDTAITAGFVNPRHRDILVIDDHVEALLDRIETHEVPRVSKW